MLRIGQIEATATSDGKYTDGNVAGGIPSTRLRALAFTALQEELANIVESTGTPLDPNDMTQVLSAMRMLFLNRESPFSDINSDGPNAIAAALANLGLKEAAKRDVGNATNQIPDMSFFTHGWSAGSGNSFQGFFTLPGGTLIQYGRIALYNVTNVATIDIPLSYIDTNYAVLATSDLAVSGNTVYPWFGARPHSASQIDLQQSTTSDGYACYWITIGRVS